MESLISKSVTYLGLRHVFNNKDNLIQETIQNIKNKSMRQRLTNEAKEFWAKKFKTTANKIHYGELIVWVEKFIPEYVIGNLAIFSINADASRLKRVIGSINSTHVKDFPNLEYANEIILGPDCYYNNEVNLPKLKNCKYFSAPNNKIKNLALEYVGRANLEYTDIEKLNIKKAHDLSLTGSKVKDISSLEDVIELWLDGVDISNLIVNPELKIRSPFSLARFKRNTTQL